MAWRDLGCCLYTDGGAADKPDSAGGRLRVGVLSTSNCSGVVVAALALCRAPAII